MRRARLAVLPLLLLAALPALAKAPSWDRRIDSPKRFKVLKAFDSEAVLDQETGLVWARDVSFPSVPWSLAIAACANDLNGGRFGWRLPTVSEFRSLIDPESRSLPAGNPFEVPDGYYWTSTTTANSATDAFIGDLGTPNGSVASGAKGDSHDAWCVRGGLGATIDGF